MSSIVVKAAAFDHIVWVSIVDEVFYLLVVFLIILGLILVVDLGFDIEESRSTVSSALSSVALVNIVLILFILFVFIVFLVIVPTLSVVAIRILVIVIFTFCLTAEVGRHLGGFARAGFFLLLVVIVVVWLRRAARSVGIGFDPISAVIFIVRCIRRRRIEVVIL
jgi:hypothetical protein